MFEQVVCPTDQAVLEEVPPDTARELGKAKAEGEKEGEPEIVGSHLGNKQDGQQQICCTFEQTRWSATKILNKRNPTEK